ncbi:hypothetical protein dsx2_0577 [Desulfovibrio sp. X2]|uniref:hypothetical protein n=1 Tax=Desulfovibrio sp. X2 TaxID=941449 RepID=UPI000358E499|nr:hypothetical protein [Desulfovibrio sp. X2]EPR37645.1 hypothetical protein dsx2_0577 [Desulfovibrio sp. X2]
MSNGKVCLTQDEINAFFKKRPRRQGANFRARTEACEPACREVAERPDEAPELKPLSLLREAGDDERDAARRATAKGMALLALAFDEIDADRDGMVSREDLSAYIWSRLNVRL